MFWSYNQASELGVRFDDAALSIDFHPTAAILSEKDAGLPFLMNLSHHCRRVKMTGIKLLVTGGMGFIGSAVVREAIRLGYEIINIDALTYAANTKNLSSIASNKKYFFEHTDIRDRVSLAQIFEKYQPDAVMHLAAESHVDRSINKPSNFIDTNIVGTFNMLDVARNYWENRGRPDTFRFHHVSTDEFMVAYLLNLLFIY